MHHDLRYELYDGKLKLVDCYALVQFDASRGELDSLDIYGQRPSGVLPGRPSSLPYRDADLAVARATVAAGAFARLRLKGRLGEWLEEQQPAEPGLWLARRLETSETTEAPTDAQLDAATRAEGTPVWVVRMVGPSMSVKGETVAAPLVIGYVDAATGQLLAITCVDPRDGGFGGAISLPKTRPTPALSGSAMLTLGGKGRSVRLVPVAATRPFAATRKAVLELGKRIAEVEYDAKAGLVRFRGKLARTLVP